MHMLEYVERRAAGPILDLVAKIDFRSELRPR